MVVGYFSILLGILKIYFDQTRGDGRKTNQDVLVEGFFPSFGIKI